MGSKPHHCFRYFQFFALTRDQYVRHGLLRSPLNSPGQKRHGSEPETRQLALLRFRLNAPTISEVSEMARF